ncbi:MAG TPA: diacylglycerol kinase family protein [Kofleriaceae bacterium]|nr:diacylglycerol kinase family protein [Kofleriaceae bacterium]
MPRSTARPAERKAKMPPESWPKLSDEARLGRAKFVHQCYIFTVGRRFHATGAPATILVANPTAQSGKAAMWIRRARALLDANGVRHQFVPTEPGGVTVARVRGLIDDQGYRRVIYLGGDGTFAEVAKGILYSAHANETLMGMFPTGTANDQGKSFGLESGPNAFARNANVIAAGEVVGCDVGKLEVERGGKIVHHDMFFDSFSIGIGASSLATRNRDRQRVRRVPGLSKVYRDYATYGGAILQRFAETYMLQVKFDLDAIIDNRVVQYRELLDVVVKNTLIFGGEWVFDNKALSDDGKFELLPVTGRRDFTTKMFAGFRHNPVGTRGLEALGLHRPNCETGANFELVVRGRGGPLPGCQIDGEEAPAGERYRIAVLPRALNLIVPADFVEPSKLS